MMRAPDLTGKGGAGIASASDANGQERNATGRHTVVFRKGATDEGVNFLRAAGFDVFVSNSDDPQVTREDQVGNANVIVYPKLGVATVGAGPLQISELKNAATDSNSPILMVKTEKVRRLLTYETFRTADPTVDTGVTVSLGYLEGCRDTIDTLFQKFAFNGESSPKVSAAPTLNGFNESQNTWGLQATRVIDSALSGRGIKVAILDTGIDFTNGANGDIKFHRDFDGRSITTASFVPGVPTAKDGNGHGTHCIGTACGPRRPSVLPGYGIANEAEIYAGKVLDDEGSGADGWILAGIEWAINQGCRIVSMSLGATKLPGDTFNDAYEEVAQRALDAGTLIIAAAGNDSARPGIVMPVNGPADCPSILAVAAVDPELRIARFSNAGINPRGGEVNIAGPGVNVHSSFLNGHKRLQGTSMATPHVAGIAALFAEGNSALTARQLKDAVIRGARRLSFGVQDVGSGLVQAPISETKSRIGSEGPMPIRAAETSPIIVGGGGSVGLDFDHSRYVPNGGGGVFVSSNERLTTVQVMHQSGKHLRNFFPEINGNPCIVTIECRDSEGQVSPIRISGAPSGQLSVAFSETDFPMNAAKQLHYGATFKVTSISVEHVVTGATASFTVPNDWAGTILIDN